jgi:hypothetical protein
VEAAKCILLEGVVNWQYNPDLKLCQLSTFAFGAFALRCPGDVRSYVGACGTRWIAPSSSERRETGVLNVRFLTRKKERAEKRNRNPEYETY